MRSVLWTVAAITAILWALGLITAFTLEGWIHVFGCAAVALALMGWMAGED